MTTSPETASSAHAFRHPGPPERPASPPESYGVPQTGGVLVEWDHVMHRLLEAPAYWLATLTTDMRPHVVPIWGVVVGDDLYLEVGDPQTAKARNLGLNDNVVVHLDDAADVVIVRGRATPVRPEPTLAHSLAQAFRVKYANYDPGPDSWDGGGLVRIEPETVLAWTDMPTATRWRLGDRRSNEEGPA